MSAHFLSIAAVLILLSPNKAMIADRISDGQWFHQYLNTAEAHRFSMGEGVKVAVVDSGVDATHPDLANSLLAGTDLSGVQPGNGDGHSDGEGHGTAMAGLIAAHGRVSGVAPAARVIPIRITGSSPGTATKMAQGVRLAVAKNADVISVSRGITENDLTLRQELEAAIRANLVVVAAVGNRPALDRVGYPAAIPGVLAVAGVDREGNRSRVSVAGPEVDIAAPSDGISSTDKGGGYREGTGTSDAAAIVAGAVALVRARFPSLKAPEVVRRLTATATDKGAPGRDDEYGHGVLNIVAALTAELPGETASQGAVASAAGAVSPGGGGTDAGAGRQGVPGRGRVVWWVVGVVSVGVVVGAIWLRRRRTG